MANQERRSFRLIDIGAGFATSIMHFAQKIHGFFAGIENDPIRCRIFGNSSKRLIQDHHEDIANMKLAYFFKDLNNVNIFDFDVIYSIDEVFTLNDWRKLMHTFVESPKAKFWITFKPLKFREGSNSLFSEMMDNDLIHLESLSVQMKGSQEVSKAGFLVKRVFWKQKHLQ
jgi:hypothetical protein